MKKTENKTFQNIKMILLIIIGLAAFTAVSLFIRDQVETAVISIYRSIYELGQSKGDGKPNLFKESSVAGDHKPNEQDDGYEVNRDMFGGNPLV